jgi:hypothetical protein
VRLRTHVKTEMPKIIIEYDDSDDKPTAQEERAAELEAKLDKLEKDAFRVLGVDPINGCIRRDEHAALGYLLWRTLRKLEAVEENTWVE